MICRSIAHAFRQGCADLAWPQIFPSQKTESSMLHTRLAMYVSETKPLPLALRDKASTTLRMAPKSERYCFRNNY